MFFHILLYYIPVLYIHYVFPSTKLRKKPKESELLTKGKSLLQRHPHFASHPFEQSTGRTTMSQLLQELIFSQGKSSESQDNPKPIPKKVRRKRTLKGPQSKKKWKPKWNLEKTLEEDETLKPDVRLLEMHDLLYCKEEGEKGEEKEEVKEEEEENTGATEKSKLRRMDDSLHKVKVYSHRQNILTKQSMIVKPQRFKGLSHLDSDLQVNLIKQ